MLLRLKADDTLRQLCGWKYAHELPHESTFCRAFAEFSEMQLPQITHEMLIRETQRTGSSGTSPAIRQRFTRASAFRKRLRRRTSRAEVAGKNKAKPSANRRKPGPKLRKTKRTPASRDTRIERQKTTTVEQMLAEIPQESSIGVKMNSRRQPKYWLGYKLHLDVADGQIPITAVLSSANVHDSQLSVPLTTITSQRVTWLYEVMDSA